MRLNQYCSLNEPSNRTTDMFENTTAEHLLVIYSLHDKLVTYATIRRVRPKTL